MSIPNGSIVAYFSMEICLEQAIPTYSGGLGVLAGDTLRAAADLEVPMIAVTLVDRKGYFTQTLDSVGQQHEEAESWSPETMLAPVSERASCEIQGRRVEIRAWRYEVRGAGGHIVPVFLLDTDLEENSEWDRTLTDTLYGGDSHYRLCQEVVLGMGGAAMLEALGYADRALYHINEGHAALLTLTLLERELAGRARHDISEADLERVRHRCIFTTHTPVPAGHDRFDESEYKSVLGDDRAQLLIDARVVEDHTLNMTHLALRLSRYVNAVAMRHREISQGMFPDYPIDSITNGVHATTWAATPFQELFDRRIPEWRRDNQYLRYAIDIPARGNSRRARRDEGRAVRCAADAQWGQARSVRADDRLRTPRDAVQARRSRSSPTSSGSRRSPSAREEFSSCSVGRRIRATREGRRSSGRFSPRPRRSREWCRSSTSRTTRWTSRT